MKKFFLISYTFLSLINYSTGQENLSLSSEHPLHFTSLGSETYNTTVIYNSTNNGLLFDLARTTNSETGRAIDFRIDARGGGKNFFAIDGLNGNTGIGTFSPEWKLHVKGAITAEGDGGGNSPDINLKNGEARWHISGPRIGERNRLGIFWYDGSSPAKDLFTFTPNGDLGIGISSPAYKLDVCGSIRAREVNVNLQGGCDFVFKNEYKLMPLNTLETYVKTNLHLPEIASEKEMINNGVNMKDLQMKLLQKVEELTLYTIELNNQIESVKEQHRLLKIEMERLRK